LGEPGVLPLRAGDRFAIVAQVSRPAYLYVVWIDADGRPSPVYPWRPGHGDGRPQKEEPVRELRRPEVLTRYYGIPAGTPGMETVLLGALEEPLPTDFDLKKELAGLPAQRRQAQASVVWFEDGRVVRDEPGRAPSWDEKEVGDPLRATQERLR